ncbi:HPr kinase/phosphatase C-terminal domain-containing protein [Caulobacter sp. 73W]|uniref:HPr kinase/phosphatase C-terminal domain-containing protein n=1 Tax=Caulobacter sp. 73W TaxID=3161137 RepID=A0AB39KQJ0_9CAUL
MILHAGLVALWSGGGWRGLLIEGASGSGKSDLALRSLEHGFRLVADDRVVAWNCEDRLFGRAPDTLSGLMETRGLGVLPQDSLRLCEIDLCVRCVAADVVERLPDLASTQIEGVSIPRLDVWPFDTAAPLKLVRAMQHLGAGLR